MGTLLRKGPMCSKALRPFASLRRQSGLDNAAPTANGREAGPACRAPNAMVLSELNFLIGGAPILWYACKQRMPEGAVMLCPHCTSTTTRERTGRTQLGYRMFVCQ